MNIQEIRSKYPQYDTMSDTELADKLHDKFYSDMPKGEFYTRIGIASKAPQEKETTVGGVIAEGAKGLLRGAGNTARMIPENLPVIGPIIKPAIEALSGPSQRLVAPNPQNTAEQMASTGSEIAGGVAVGGVGGGLRQAVVNVGLPAVGGAVGEQLGGEPGKVIGSLAAPATQLVAAGASAARSNLANRVQENVNTFREAGAGSPSVGQATEVNFFQGLENMLSKFPGGQAVFRRFAENQQKSMGANRPGVSAEDAGRAIESGIKGEGGFIERTKETWLKLDQKLADKVGSSYNIPPSKTLEAFDALTKPVAGAEKTTAALVNPKIAKIAEDFKADVNNNLGGMPFEAMRNLRSRVGALLDDALVSGIPGGELKKIYGAMSKDMEAAAKAVGAEGEFARQSQYYAARIDRIENMLERTIGKTPEETFKRFMPTDPDKVTTVRGVMRSLDPEQKKIVQDAVVSRLGRAKSGVQDESGSVFSSETFLTNWNNMSPGAKAQIFSDPAVRQNMDSLAKASANIREGSEVLANPAGTAGRSAGYVLGGSVATSVVTGNPIPAAAAAAAVVGSNIGARMLTSPKIVEWLAQAPKVGPDQMAGHLARLGVIYNSTKDEGLKKELAEYMEEFSPQRRGAPSNTVGGGTR